jgi:1,4-dihydroxy-2-naphthoate octaprenyltransferase
VWTLGIGPVGTAPGLIWWRAACALVVALAVQVGTNYANDYADGVRGTDADRVGPLRLVASGLVAPAVVRRAALLAFAVAGAAGLALAAATTWWLVPVGAACIAAGWFYTGGPRPYGYLGLGELFVFVFFGLVATAGSAYVQSGHLLVPVLEGLSGWARFDWLVALWAAVPVGLLATALLEANNLRDVEGDARAGKRTLAVRLGRARAGWLYMGSVGLAAAGIVLVGLARPWALTALGAMVLAVRPSRLVLSGARGRELLPVLGATGRLQLAVGVLLAAGILV